MERCTICGWVLNFEHAFNIKCAVANAENDQLEAEVAEAMKQPWTEEDEENFKFAKELVSEELAKARFNRMIPAEYLGGDPT